MEETDIAYLAGLIDGEGSIYIGKSKPSYIRGAKNPTYRLHLDITSTYYPIMEYLIDKYGGCLHYREGKGRKNSWGALWQGERACELLESVLPYLVIKRDEAVIAIQFQKGKISGWFRGAGGQTSEDLTRCEFYKWKLQELKKYSYDKTTQSETNNL